jgi:hypothetical protein
LIVVSNFGPHRVDVFWQPRGIDVQRHYRCLAAATARPAWDVTVVIAQSRRASYVN